jgi:TPR repeat protein
MELEIENREKMEEFEQEETFEECGLASSSYFNTINAVHCEELYDFINTIYYYKKVLNNYKDPFICYHLGKLYQDKRDKINMLKYYLKGIEVDNVECMYALAKYYEINHHTDKMEKYYSLAIKHKYLNAFHAYGTWLKKNRRMETTIQIFSKAIDLFIAKDYVKDDIHLQDEIEEKGKSHNEIIVLNMLESVSVYYDDKNDYDLSSYYYNIAINMGSILAMFNLGHQLYEQKDFENMKKYYLMAIELGDIDSMFEMAIYHQDIDDIENFKKYYIMAIEHKSSYTGNKLINDGIKDFNAFNIKAVLDSIEKPSCSVLTQINLLRNNKFICIYENKVNLFKKLNNIIECGICYETKLNIDLNCGHCCCVDCYPKLHLKPCPYCRN